MPTGTAAQRIIEIDGSELDPEVEAALESALVLDRLAMPDMFQLVFRDPAREPGQGGSHDRRGHRHLDQLGGQRLARGAHRRRGHLHRGGIRLHGHACRRPRLRPLTPPGRGAPDPDLPERKYSDIAQQVAGDAGLSADVDDSGGTLEHVLQANQSRPRFPLRAATDRLRLPGRRREAPVQEARDDVRGARCRRVRGRRSDAAHLERHAPRIPGSDSAVGQVRTVKVRGWDVEKRKPSSARPTSRRPTPSCP